MKGWLFSLFITVLALLPGCNPGPTAVMEESFAGQFTGQFAEVRDFRLRQQTPWQKGGLALATFNAASGRDQPPEECQGIAYFSNGLEGYHVFEVASSCGADGPLGSSPGDSPSLEKISYRNLALAEQDTSVVFGLVEHPDGAQVRVDWQDGESQAVEIVNNSYLAPRRGFSELKRVSLLDRYGNLLATQAVGASVVESTTSITTSGESMLQAILALPDSLPTGEVVKLRFSLVNRADSGLYVLKWLTPLEGIAGEIFRVERDGRAIPYQGILASRGNPTPDAYVFLKPGGMVSTEVDLATAYDFSEAGNYTVEFLSPRSSHVARTEAEMAKSLDDLGPVPMPANEVAVRIGAAGPPPTPVIEEVAQATATAVEPEDGLVPEAPAGADPEKICYISQESGISFEYPSTWELEQEANAFLLRNGSLTLRIGYRRAGEQADLFVRSGLPAGDIILLEGQAPFLGQGLAKNGLIFEDKVKMVFYGQAPVNIVQAGAMEFSIILEDPESDFLTLDISEEAQAEAEAILGSFAVGSM